MAGRRFSRKHSYAAIALVVLVVVLVAVPIGAPLLLGARGDLLALMVEWLWQALVGAAFALLLGILAYRAKRLLRWACVAGILLFGGIALYGCWSALWTGIDLVIPFEQREVMVSKTYYVHPQTGRGAMPESGGWHLVTAGGEDYTVREWGPGREVKAGAYRIELSHFKRMVMSAAPVR